MSFTSQFSSSMLPVGSFTTSGRVTTSKVCSPNKFSVKSDSEVFSGGFVRNKENSSTTSWLSNKLAKMAFLAALIFSTGGNSTSHQNISLHFSKDAKHPTYQTVNSAWKSQGLNAVSPTLSKTLQNGFDFKTAQWAAILKIERKTLYNWDKNPGTKIQSKVADRLLILKDFYGSIDPEHTMFISKMTFGRYSDDVFLSLLNSDDLSLEKLISAYDEHYIEIDGLYKRLKHSV